MKTRTWLAPIAALLGVGAAAQAGELDASLDRSSIAAGESVELVLRGPGDGTGAEPDLSPLREDFDVLAVQRGFQVSILGDHRETSAEWRIRLAPRRSGRIELPTLVAGSARSEPLVLEVGAPRARASAAADAHAPAPERVFVEARVDDAAPYVQGQVVLRILLHAGPGTLEGTLADPVVEDAIVERVGEDRRSRREIEGVPYEVIERRFAVFPQRSGRLEIAPVIFEGLVASERPRRPRDLFAGLGGRGRGAGSLLDDFFGRSSLLDDFFGPEGRAVRAVSNSVELDVRPRPEQATAGWWLPAQNLVLTEEWTQDPPTFRVGEPVERVITLRARGLSPAQLPKPSLPPVDGLNQYTDPWSEATRELDGGVEALKRTVATLVPTQAGTQTLPALEIEWWDPQADAPRVARLPARSFEVLPAADVAATLPTPAESVPEGPSPPEVREDSSLEIVGLGAVIFTMLALTGLWMLRAGRSVAREAEDARPVCDATPPTRRTIAGRERALQHACRASDPEAALRALLDLAEALWPTSRPPSAVEWGTRLASSDLEQAVQDLNRVRYSEAGGRFHGKRLWQAYLEAKRGNARTGRARGATLPPLYPAY
jgi:hypothetical protein